MILIRCQGILTSCQQRAGNAQFTLMEVNRRANPLVQTSFLLQVTNFRITIQIKAYFAYQQEYGITLCPTSWHLDHLTNVLLLATREAPGILPTSFWTGQE